MPDRGILLTRPFQCQGDELVINASCPNGWIRAEVLNASGEVLDGYGRHESVAFDGDALSHPMRWNGKPGLTELRGQDIRLKFSITNATMYAFQVLELSE